ncbi:MAG: CoA-binding protein, partial [Candidatus Bathyarchaeia archaeon]
MCSVKTLFEPKTVLLVGSSRVKEKVGLASPWLFENIIYNMRKFFKGKTYILDIDGKAGFGSIEELPEIPELAVVMLPPRDSLRYVEGCAASGVKAFILITGGYKDDQRRQLLKVKEEYGVRILGPNTVMGVINTANGLNTTFERDVMPKRGNIAIISQSGGVGACLLDWACFYGVGLSKVAFMGDKVDVDDADMVKYFGEDAETRVICLYMEGVKNGRRFIEEARKVVGRKPIIALKGGATQES